MNAVFLKTQICCKTYLFEKHWQDKESKFINKAAYQKTQNFQYERLMV